MERDHKVIKKEERERETDRASQFQYVLFRLDHLLVTDGTIVDFLHAPVYLRPLIFFMSMITRMSMTVFMLRVDVKLESAKFAFRFHFHRYNLKLAIFSTKYNPD